MQDKIVNDAPERFHFLDKLIHRISWREMQSHLAMTIGNLKKSDGFINSVRIGNIAVIRDYGPG